MASVQGSSVLLSPFKRIETHFIPKDTALVPPEGERWQILSVSSDATVQFKYYLSNGTVQIAYNTDFAEQKPFFHPIVSEGFFIKVNNYGDLLVSVGVMR